MTELQLTLDKTLSSLAKQQQRTINVKEKLKKCVAAKKRLTTKYKILEAKSSTHGVQLYQGGSPGKNKKHSEAY
jgi:hypothetical protein